MLYAGGWAGRIPGGISRLLTDQKSARQILSVPVHFRIHRVPVPSPYGTPTINAGQNKQQSLSFWKSVLHGKDISCRSGRRPRSQKLSFPDSHNAGCHGIPCHSQVVIFIDQSHIQARRTGLTMVAIHAVPHSLPRRKCTDNRIVPFFGEHIKKSQQIFYILHVPDARQHRQHSRLIQCILDTLITCQRPAKR